MAEEVKFGRRKEDMADLQIPNLTDSQKLYQGMVEHLMSVSTGLNDVQHTVDEHEKILVKGNGELPLREQVRNHDNFIKDIKYWVRFVGGAIVLQTLAFTIGLVVAVVKFLPVLEQLAKAAKP